MKNTTESPRAAPTGRKFDSVKALMQESGVTKEKQEKVEQLISDSRIAMWLAQLRHRACITQKQMADQLGVTQSAISKLEAGNDDDITLKQVKEYARLTGDRISLFFGKPYSHTEAVQLCANALKYRLDQLADIANQNVELQRDIKAFLADAFFGLCNIITSCNDKLPIGADDVIEDIRMEVVTGKTVVPSVCEPASAPRLEKDAVKP
jgi:transcriptional regulator with XRE-family HTH domain